MKLPGVRRRGVESLGRWDVSGPGRVWAAETRARQVLAGEIRNVSQFITKLDQERQKKEAVDRVFQYREKKRGTLDYLNNTETYDLNDPAQQQFLSGVQQSLDLSDGAGGTRSVINKHEVYSDVWNIQSQRIREDSTKGLTPFQLDIFNQMTRDEDLAADRMIAKGQLLATNEHIKTTALSQIETLAEQGRFADARTMLQDTRQFSEKEKAKYSDDIDKMVEDKEVGSYAEDIMSQNEGRIRASLAEISDPNYAGSLSESKRLTVWSRLKRAADKLEADRTSTTKVNTKMLEFSAKQSAEALMSGMAPTTDMAAEVEALEAAGKFAKATQLKMAMSYSMVLSEMSHLPFQEQEEALEVMKANATSPEEFNVLDGVSKTLEKQRRAFNKDTVKFALESDNYEISEIDWSQDPEALTASLQKRWHDISKIRTQTGDASGFLSEMEVAEFNAAMIDASPTEEQQMREVINRGFGREANKVWGQLKVKQPSAKNKAGDISAYDIAGSQQVADSVSRGIAMMQESPDYFKPQIKEAKKSEAYRGFSTLYMPGTPEHSSMMNAIEGRYAYLAGSSGVTEFDQDLYEQAGADVTGGVVDMLGRTVEAPIPGMTQDAVDDWLGEITPAYLEALGDPSWDSRILAEAIRDGDMALYPVGRNMYGIGPADRPGEIIWDKFKGQPYRFYYDPQFMGSQPVVDAVDDWISP